MVRSTSQAGKARAPKRAPAKKAAQKRAKGKATRAPAKNPLAEFDLAVSAMSKKYAARTVKKTKDGKPEKMPVKFKVASLPLTGEVISRVHTYIPTGIMGLDRILPRGGVPAGRVTELYGPNHVGKSTLLDMLTASVQRMGGYGVLADAEGARDEVYTAKLGVDVEALRTLAFPRGDLSVEAVLNVMYDTSDWWWSNYPENPVVMGWDALGGTATIEENTKPIGDRVVAGAAKVMRTSMRQVAGRLGGTNVAIVICNHEYALINKNTRKTRDTYGGEALKHAASLRLELFLCGLIVGAGGVVLGREVGIRVVKNRLGIKGECRLALLDGLGFSNLWTVHKELSAAGVIVQNGSWSTMVLDGTEIKFQGWHGLDAKCQADPELWQRLVFVAEELSTNAAV